MFAFGAGGVATGAAFGGVAMGAAFAADAAGLIRPGVYGSADAVALGCGPHAPGGGATTGGL